MVGRRGWVINMERKKYGWMEQREAEVGEVGVKTEDGNVREEIFCRCLKGGGLDK